MIVAGAVPANAAAQDILRASAWTTATWSPGNASAAGGTGIVFATYQNISTVWAQPISTLVAIAPTAQAFQPLDRIDLRFYAGSAPAQSLPAATYCTLGGSAARPGVPDTRLVCKFTGAAIPNVPTESRGYFSYNTYVAPGHPVSANLVTDAQALMGAGTSDSDIVNTSAQTMVNSRAPYTSTMNAPQTGSRTVSGTGNPGSTVAIFNASDTLIGSARVGNDGTWQMTLPVGSGMVTPRYTDVANVAVTGSAVFYNSYTFSIAQPSDNATVTGRPSLSGVAQPSSKIDVREGTRVIASTTANASGNWSVVPLVPLAPGTRVLDFTNTTTDGKTTTQNRTVVILPTPAPSVAPTRGETVTGTGPAGASIEVRDASGVLLATTTVQPDGTYSVTPSPRPADGSVLNVVAVVGSVPSAASSVVVDAAPPVAPTVRPSNGSQVAGTGEPGSTVVVKDGTGATLATGVVGADGTFSLTLDPVPSDGTGLSVTLEDAAGNVSPPAGTVVDAVRPDAPMLAASGGSRVTGGAEPHSTVTVTDASGTVLGSAVADDEGVFSIVLDPAQPDGATLTVTAVDPAGNASEPATLTVDEDVPDAPAVHPTNGRLVTGVAEPGSLVTAYDDSGTVLGAATAGSDGAYSIDLDPALKDGESVIVTVTDSAGNASAPTIVDVDAEAPRAPVVNPTSGSTVTGAAEPGSTVTVRDDDGDVIGSAVADDDGVFSVSLDRVLGDGDQVTVRSTDAAGNVSDSTPLTVDAVPPTTPTVDPSDGSTVSGSAEPHSTVTVRDGSGVVLGTGTADADGAFEIELPVAAPDGATITVTATDPAGNASDAASVTVVHPAPDAPELDPTNGSSVTGSAKPGSTVTVRDAGGNALGSASVGADGVFSVELDPKPADGQALVVTVTDAAGNTSEAASVTVDGRPPVVPSVGATNGGTVTGTAEPGSTVVVKDHAGNVLGTATAGEDGSFSISPRPHPGDGDVLSVTATDPAGNESAPAAVTVDQSAPALPSVNPTNGSTVTGSAEPGSTVTVKDARGATIGTGVVGDDGSFSVDLDPQPGEGEEISVSVVDSTGNESAPATVTVDAEKPSAPVVNPTSGSPVTGSALPGSTVTVKDGEGNTIGTGAAGEDGSFSIELAVRAAAGSDLLVTATDSRGVESDPVVVVVDAYEIAIQLDLGALPVGARQVATGTGFLPGEEVSGVMHSDPIALGSQIADADGRVTFTWEIPAETPAGQHRIELTGALSGMASATFLVEEQGAAISPPATGRASAAPAGGLAATGADPLPYVGFASGVLALAALLFVSEGLRRRRAVDDDAR